LDTPALNRFFLPCNSSRKDLNGSNF